MDIDAYLRVRPRLYHLTAATNLPFIQRTGRIRPAAELLHEADQSPLVRARRPNSRHIVVNGERVHIRDQAPLYEKNMALDPGVSFGDFVEYVNRHVFFWPGNSDGPIDYGVRHFSRYADEDCVVLCIDARRLLGANRGLLPKFSAYNSGSPRWSGGVASPRGLSTFLHASAFSRAPSEVIETVFECAVTLPQGAWDVRSHREFI